MEKESKGTKIDTKAKDYVEQLITSTDFRNSIYNIRGQCSIPKKGFSILMFDEFVVADIYPRIPKEINIILFEKLINLLLRKYGFSQSWFDYFSDYILFGYIGDTTNKKQILFLDLGGKNKNLANDRALFEINLNQNPIVVLIPPFASQRDINDFISNNWDEIERIQKKYNKKSIKISSVRKKNDRVKRRNAFIYNHRDLTKKELMSKVADKFGDTMDYTYLSKIIASESKKRSVDG